MANKLVVLVENVLQSYKYTFVFLSFISVFFKERQKANAQFNNQFKAKQTEFDIPQPLRFSIQINNFPVWKGLACFD